MFFASSLCRHQTCEVPLPTPYPSILGGASKEAIMAEIAFPVVLGLACLRGVLVLEAVSSSNVVARVTQAFTFMRPNEAAQTSPISVRLPSMRHQALTVSAGTKSVRLVVGPSGMTRIYAGHMLRLSGVGACGRNIVYTQHDTRSHVTTSKTYFHCLPRATMSCAWWVPRYSTTTLISCRQGRLVRRVDVD